MPDPDSPEPTPVAGGWKSRPVFISSTFKDLQQERDWLNRHVFPRLQEELAKRHHHLEPIDLRLGVKTAEGGSEEARELLVLKVCLDEIKRSKPFLLVLLGDRYGWVPPEERIEAAAREQGFETSPAGKSVTALEIEYGILKDDPAQKQRSLFFLRRPLPYDQMPEAVRADYSDAHSPDPKVCEGHAKLAAIKERLRADPELAGRIHEYDAGWDPAADQVSGLQAFGELVYEKLWAALDEETREFAAQPTPEWDDQERAALADFVEHRSRGFVGRDEILDQLLEIARSPAGDRNNAHQNTEAPPPWGACVTGVSGSGKSALFAKLHRELESDPSVLLLANANGATLRGSSVDSMLRRWIGELARAAAVDDPLGEQASNDDVEDAFYALLHRVSERRRVLVLLDALDQAEPSPRGRHLTWFKQPRWPQENARLIATTLPCPAAGALSRSAGIEEIELPPLTVADAREVAAGVWGRYHRHLDPAVRDVLLEKELPDGTPACGNPLWLTLALEQLNLLDADDFARAEREFNGSPIERMTALLLDTAGRMPPDIDDLYGWLLEYHEECFGEPPARAFAAAIALSRSGWRESDLLQFVPRLARHFDGHPPTIDPPESEPETLDPLVLAALRRGLRSHIIRRGENDQLDFFHARMRPAVLARCAPDEDTRRELHAAISDYLETLDPRDPIIRLERMEHLIGERNALRAARYYATLDSSGPDTGERTGSSWTLVEWIAGAEAAGETNSHLEWIATWLGEDALDDGEAHRLANNLQFGLFEKLENDVSLGTRQRLVEATRDCLERLAAADPSNAGWQRDLSVSHERIGNVLLAQGDLAGALKAYRESLEVRARLAAADPSNAGWQRDLSVSHNKVGDVLLAQGDLAGALKAYRESLEVRARLAAADPSNAGWQRDLSVSHNKVGDVLRAQGDLAGALKAYRETQAILARLAAADPSNAGWQRDLSVSHDRIGDVLLAQGDLAGALKAYRESLEVRARLAAADPSNAGWQRDLSVSHNKVGDVLLAQGDLAGALKAYRESLEVAARLAAADPSNAGWQRDLFVSYWRMADMAEKSGTGEALEWWRKAYDRLFDMQQRGIMLPTDEPHLEFLRTKVGG